MTKLRQQGSHLRMKLKTLRVFVLLSFGLSSCVPIDRLIYLQDTTESSTPELLSYNNQEYRLQVNDILEVTISSLNPEINALFNSSALGTFQVAQATAQTGGDLFYMTGYSVSQSGEIDIPFVGRVPVLGLTLQEAYDAVNQEVEKLFNNFHLKLKLGGVRFSGLGEFNRPGKRVVMQNQVTIFEAIALCGDMTMVADRQNVQLIRQYPEGTKVHSINLLEKSIVTSPFYFIQPNDVLYAEPLPQRSWGVGITGSQTLSTIVSTLSTSLALILSIISLNQ